MSLPGMLYRYLFGAVNPDQGSNPNPLQHIFYVLFRVIA